MATEKDRLGEKLHDAEKGREDQYFSKRDKELLERLRGQREKELKDELTKAAELICPRCGAHLSEQVHQGVAARKCPSCGGLWLDKDALELLADRDRDGWLGRLFGARAR